MVPVCDPGDGVDRRSDVGAGGFGDRDFFGACVGPCGVWTAASGADDAADAAGDDVSDAGDGDLLWELLFEFAGVEAAVGWTRGLYLWQCGGSMRSTNDDLKKTVEASRILTAELAASPEKARAFLVEMGLITPDGKLTENYK